MSTAIAAEPLVVGPDDNGILMTIDEFDAIEEYDECYRYELINGVFVVNPIPSQGERDPNEELGHLLRVYRDEHPGFLGKTLFEEYIRLPNSRRRADRVIWAGLGRVPNVKTDVPTIAVEFVSRSRRDRHRDYVLKRDEYMALGVCEYWIIDRFARTMTVYQPGKNEAKETVVGEREIYRTPLLPGFELKLSSLLDVADDWDDS
jgi:Uma2 family endonuclease